MTESRITAYADAILSIARAEGRVSETENELFQVARSIDGSDELKSTLADASVPVARRQQIVEDVLGAGVPVSTVAIVSMIVGAGRAADLGAIVDEFIRRAAGSRGEEVAEVRSAVPLTDEQIARLAAALGARSGQAVSVRNIVDPTVLGGVVTQIGDTLLDGSVRTRLTQLRDAF